MNLTQESGTCHLVSASLATFVVSWAVPIRADRKGTLPVTEVTGKEALTGSPGTGMLVAALRWMEDESWDTTHREFPGACFLGSFQIVTLGRHCPSPVPKLSGWALLCHGRKGDSTHSCVGPRPAGCAASGFWSGSSLSIQRLAVPAALHFGTGAPAA